MGNYNVNTICEAIAAAITASPLGLRAHAYVPTQVSPPEAHVHVETIEYDHSMGRGVDQLHFIVTILISGSSDRAGQQNLNKMMDKQGQHSFKAALQGNLGGVVQVCHVPRMRLYGPLNYMGIDYFGAEFELLCYA